ncbi:hypothetical protein BD626DRAFT_500788 [Schizophyllum amplum]|uniref:Hamartin protein-domain-containing protein n=1 Tax=Schizophyllum amplum TaxID=97359 RepID=A0A550CAP6_9AGAR|nr:hypothetical protein BD626DRAFT_500788 [Auriculariopsis ampla]
MSLANISRQLRAIATQPADAFALSELLVTVDDFVVACTPELVLELEEELQTINAEEVDHTILYHIQVFLAVLSHLESVLSADSIISSWFDLILRPALREAKLSTASVDQAKELVLAALRKADDASYDKVCSFRRRLLDLYLGATFNEAGDDVLEWAELDEREKDRCAVWKSNLEDVLLKHGTQCPAEFMDEVNAQFAQPEHRLQLIALLNLYAMTDRFAQIAPILASHPLLTSLLNSLLLDNSSTACTCSILLMVKMLPTFAVHASQDLKRVLPLLLAILARIMSWRGRPAPTMEDPDIIPVYDPDLEAELDRDTRQPLQINPDFEWQRLELTFSAATSAPSPRPLYTMLYYLFPCNVIKFLRGPLDYLLSHDVPSPYTVDWSGAFDDAEIRSKSEHLVRTHICHPIMIWQDASVEMGDTNFWSAYDVARMISDASMLDIVHTSVGVRERFATLGNTITSSGGEPHAPAVLDPESTPVDPTTMLPTDNALATSPSSHDSASVHNPPADASSRLDTTSGPPLISLQDMITTSVALKSRMDVRISNTATAWPNLLFATSPGPGHQTSPSHQPSSGHAYQMSIGHARRSSSGQQAPSPGRRTSSSGYNSSSSGYRPASPAYRPSSPALSFRSSHHTSSPTYQASSPAPSHRTLPGDSRDSVSMSRSGSVNCTRPSDTASITTTADNRVAQALASLQREVVLLRNELNFELWLSRENVKHIGRLYQDRTLYRSAETERQALYNKLRKYRTQVNDLERQLREHKQLASSTKNKYAEWNMELAHKLRQLRDAQKAASDEKAALRQAETQAKALFDAQGKLLSEANQSVFELRTQIVNNQHKIDRLHDYEAQIEQHVKMQRLWDGDFRKFNARGEEGENMKTEIQQLRMHLSSYYHQQCILEENSRAQRQEIHTLQAHVAKLKRAAKQPFYERRASDIAEFARVKAEMGARIERLKEEKRELQEIKEELEYMNETLRAQVQGTMGLVSPRSGSPVVGLI